jgi:CubicO group peptidase (beta-lactamase class C family)
VKVCATNFDSIMRSRILVPLGMHASGYLWNDSWARRMARGHDANGAPNDKPYTARKPSPPAVARYGSSGALLATPSDYARFLLAIIEPPPPDAFHLTRTTLREMLRPQVKVAGQYPSSWALGWQVFHGDGRDFIYHGGDNKGFHCGALATVDGRCGYVVMTNGDGGPELLRKLVTDDLVQRFLNESK